MLSVGPDFVDAVIEDADRRRLCGDIEIHVRDSQWNSHGHHNDPRYNGVLFHVVLETGGNQTVTQSGRRIPLLLISRARKTEGGPPESTPNLPIPFFNLAAAGNERFANRSEGFNLAVRADTEDQAVYSGIMESLGYPHNKGAFRALAARLPWKVVHTLVVSGEIGGRENLEDTLLWAAGIRLKPDNAPKIKLTGVIPKWVAAQGRPANRPSVRIKGAAALLFRMANAGGVVRYCEDALRRNAPAALHKLFEVRDEGVTARIGKDRACEMVVNAVLPAIHAVASIRGDRDLARLCVETYRKHPPLSENSVVKEAERLLKGYGIIAKTLDAREQQGMLHCYKIMTSSIVRSRQLPLM